MARYFGPKTELTCPCHVPRSDHRVLSSKRSGPVQSSLLGFVVWNDNGEKFDEDDS